MTRIALFAAGLAGAFAAAFFAGSALDVEARTVADAMDAHAERAVPAGLSLEQDGYRLEQERPRIAAGRPQEYVFRILAPDGDVLRDYDVEHEKRLHLILVSRPLGRFVHVHPRQRADGAWAAALRLPQSGSYRVFADFATEGERRTLGVDLDATGQIDVAAKPSEYDVELHGQGDELDFTVRRDGKRVAVEPYLGARGHLVVLREGDLAYIHAHADEDRLAFEVPYPSAGRYRLFLQFKVGGSVETATFEVRR